ncbi:DUF6526 family protein [Granulicella sibirica]|nr:DUF6526 family protein [Granulicella sibirica]
MPEPVQDLKHHASRDFPFLLAMLVLAVAFVMSIVRMVHHHFGSNSILHVFVAFALLIIGSKARSNALKVQDRVIRLEERLRFERLLPESLLAQTGELTVKQYVALRFASDAELPALVLRTVKEGLEPKAIKAAIVNWRADHSRV